MNWSKEDRAILDAGCYCCGDAATDITIAEHCGEVGVCDNCVEVYCRKHDSYSCGCCNPVCCIQRDRQ